MDYILNVIHCIKGNEPRILLWIQAIGSIALGVAALIFTYFKWKDDREKIKNDLWKDRFKIYQQALYTMSDAKICGLHNWKIKPEFMIAMHEARYIFPGSEPYNIMKKIWEINWLYNKSDREDQERMENEFDKIEIESVFSPYLQRRL